MEENILELLPPSTENFVKRIEFCAKALAYGVSKDRWSPKIGVQSFGSGEVWTSLGHPNYAKRLNEYLGKLWENQQPQISFLEVFSFATQINERQIGQRTPTVALGGETIPVIVRDYLLTPKAVALLDTPAKPPSVFISYRRLESSAFALLISARLQARGVENPYIDMRMEGGQVWESELENAIANSTAFVSIFSSEDSFSYNVRKEIAWASRNPNMKFIPVQQTSSNLQIPSVNLREYVDDAQDILLENFINKHHTIQVNEQSARGYNAAIVDILSALGYAPR